MKIALAADTHLQETFFSKNRFSELITSIIQSPNNYKFLWFIGDIFHNSRISSDLIIFFKNEMERLIDNGVIPKFIEGNHERQTAVKYLLTSTVSKLVPITRLARHFKIHNTTFSAYGHDELLNLSTDTKDKADILLAHFRWKTELYDSELSPKTLKDISIRYKLSLLGDIHMEWSPELNVMYINSPYNISYGNIVKRGYISLSVDKDGYSVERVHLDLPNKIEVTTHLDELQETLDTLSSDKINMYKVKVVLDSEVDLPQLQAHTLVGDNYMVVHTFTGSKLLEESPQPTRELADIHKAFEESLESGDRDYIMRLIES